jgi:imidazolonepropionase-like amidohydrolase
VKPALAAVLILATAAASADDAPIVLRGGRIVTVSGDVIDGGSVVIAGGKIAAVGRDVVPPAGATTVDVTGKWIYPGLLDGLGTLGLVEISSVPGSVDSSELGSMNPNAKAWVALNPHSELIPVARAGGVTSALAAPTGGLVSGQSAVIHLSGSTPEQMTVRAAAALHAVYPSGDSDDDADGDGSDDAPYAERQKRRTEKQKKALDQLSGRLEDAKAYAAAVEASAAGKAARPKPDAVLEALAPAARGTQPFVMRADKEDDIRGAVAFATARGLKLVLSGGLEAWRAADVLKEKNVPVLIKVLRLPRRRSDPYDSAYANAAILAKAGVRVGIVTDDDTFSRNLAAEAAMAHAYGLPAAAALRAITLSPAEILGVADRVGSLEAGKSADVIVASGDILDLRTQVEAVYVGGVRQSVDTRHTRLYEQFKDR